MENNKDLMNHIFEQIYHFLGFFVKSCFISYIELPDGGGSSGSDIGSKKTKRILDSDDEGMGGSDAEDNAAGQTQ